jgi:hypothetical protein
MNYPLINDGDTGLSIRTTLNDLLQDANDGNFTGVAGSSGTSGTSGTSPTSIDELQIVLLAQVFS